jgi:hypothetical protein
MSRRDEKRDSSLDPSEDEIRERCLQIQATWSKRERNKRSGHPNKPVTPPFFLERRRGRNGSWDSVEGS